MPLFECEAQRIQTITDTIDAESETQAIRVFRERHKINPETIGGKHVYAICEACEKPVFFEVGYVTTEDDVRLCTACAACAAA